jgi:hypothetical protein
VKVRTPKAVLRFNNNGINFSAWDAAVEWCRRNGLSVGSMCSPLPTCCMRGDVVIAKWRNLTTDEKAQSDAILVLLNGSYRDGDVEVQIFCDMEVAV